jgi:putative addiction module CopG family antidote
MEVHLAPEQEAFIRQRIQAGRFATPDEALREAVSLLEEQETGSHTSATGKALVAAMQASPAMDIELEPARPALPSRPLPTF